MRTILADAEPAVRRALRALLTQDLDLWVVGEADTAAMLRRRVAERRPDLLVADWDLVAGENPATLADLRRSCPDLHIVVLSLRPEMRQTALASGADAFVSKLDPPDQVVGALRALLSEHLGK